MSFTFKKHPKLTGLAGVGEPYETVDIKHQKKIVGHIYPPSWRSKGEHVWTVSLAVNETTKEKNWKWITLKMKFDSEQAARDFLKERAESILQKYDLYYFDND